VCVICGACVTSCFSASDSIVVNQSKNQFTFVQQEETATCEPCHQGRKSCYVSCELFAFALQLNPVILWKGTQGICLMNIRTASTWHDRLTHQQRFHFQMHLSYETCYTFGGFVTLLTVVESFILVSKERKNDS